MEKRTFSTAKKAPKPSSSRKAASGVSIRPKKTGAIKPSRSAPSAAGKRPAGARPGKAAPIARPPANDNKKLLIICGAVGAVILVVLIAAASGGGSQAQQPRRSASPTVNRGASTHERMMKQRYGGDMDGKTVQEWMKENGDTDWAKERRDARKNRKR